MTALRISRCNLLLWLNLPRTIAFAKPRPNNQVYHAHTHIHTELLCDASQAKFASQ